MKSTQTILTPEQKEGDLMVTPEQAKAARVELNLSQSKVAKETDIPRAYLSNFELNKQILHDDMRQRLGEYFVENGCDLAMGLNSTTDESQSKESTQPKTSNIRTRDGFVIPQDINEIDIELNLESYHEDGDTVDRLLAHSVPRGYFGNIDKEAATAKLIPILLLKARQLSSQQYLQGQIHEGEMQFPPTVKEVDTMHDYINFLLEFELQTHIDKA